MRTPLRARNSLAIPFVAITAATLLLTSCSSGTGDDTVNAAARSDEIPTTDVLSGIRKDPAAANLLPSGTAGLTLAVSVSGQPPGTSILDDGRTLAAGQDVDFANAVAKVLGVGNFGVTDEHGRTIDFVTYINDGQGFAARKDSKLSKVTDLEQLCGLNIATGAGTTFEATLEDNKHVCTDAGEKAYQVQTYNEQGTKLTPAFQAAVNKPIKDGTYAEILKKWGTTGSAITRSEISPPELKG